MVNIQRSANLGALLHKIKRGSKPSMQVIWATSSGLKISLVVGILGTVGVILVTKDRIFHNLFHKEVPSHGSWTVPGLENLGSNCFLNVVLQALASCSRFRKYIAEMMGEYGNLVVEGQANAVLVDSLNSLLEELCIVRHRRTISSPRGVMLAMDHYSPNFNLTRQQDAEEALSHLLSSLRKELSELFVSSKSSFADLPALPSARIHITRSGIEECEWERWRRTFLGPFDGMLRSVLICQSCSFQVSLNFELFHSLHLLPPINSAGAIMPGCSILDCLKQFFVAEHLENYFCSHCWHNGAIGYISVVSEDKTDILKLQQCSTYDSCDCKSISSLKSFPWSNRFSCTFKQMSIARSPKILCIHLQRASYNLFGQSVKLLGHISFPLVLDLSSFMNREVELKSVAANWHSVSSDEDSRETRPFSFSQYKTVELNLGMLNSKVDTVQSISSETEVVQEDKSNTSISANDLSTSETRLSKVDTVQSISSETEVVQEDKSNTSIAANVNDLSTSETRLSSDDCRRCPDGNVNFNVPSAPSLHQTYNLVSVVEHFGNAGAGHYTVFRRVMGRLDDDNPVSLLESAMEQWYCISDSEVHSVSEKDVLEANASMLFYERIND